MYCIGQTISKLPNDINFVWIPSHIGIPGNEVADRLARDDAKHDDVDYSVPLEQGDVQGRRRLLKSGPAM